MWKKIGLPAILAGAMAFAAVSAAPTDAHAGSKTRNFLIGLGIGVATTALVAHAIHKKKKKKLRRRYQQQAAYRYRPRPWTPEWYDYCMSKYRSFNPETGYFRTYSGRLKFCR